jgi:hypothetical protein
MVRYRVSVKPYAAEPYETTVTASSPADARMRALRRFYGNSRICTFAPYNPLPGQDPSGQSGNGYERAPRGSGADLSCATPRVRVTMDPTD